MRPRLSPRQVDWLVVAAVLLSAAPRVAHASDPGALMTGLALVPFAALPLLWRRRHPLAVLLVLTAALAVSVAVGREAPSGVGVLFGLYAAARYGGERLRLVSAVVVATACAAAFAKVLVTERARLAPQVTAAIVYGAGVAWVLGDAARTRQAYLAGLEDRAARLEHEAEEQVRRAAEQERIRIARELHDVVTHHVSAIAVQAAAAHTTSRDRPERALDALGVIERTARTTLGELRALLGLLRAGDEPTALPPMGPRPSIARLDELVAQAREAGVAVRTEVRGTPVDLDAVVDLSAYRVLQEALTNVVKHAPGAGATLLVAYAPHELRIAVTDDGPAPVPDGATGHGLVGMRERVELAGGSLRAGPAPGGGFRVEARLPLQGAGAPTGAATAGIR